MNVSMEKLIKDNPNLSHTVIARRLGIKANAVLKFRRKNECKGNWLHNGCGFPFVREYISSQSTRSFRVSCGESRIIFSGNINIIFMSCI